MKNKISIFNKWLSTGHLNTHLAKNLSLPMHPNEIAIDVKVKHCSCLIILFLSADTTTFSFQTGSVNPTFLTITLRF